MNPRDFMDAQVERIEANSAARERNRLRAGIKTLPADGWGERRFRSLVLGLLDQYDYATTVAAAGEASRSIPPERHSSPVASTAAVTQTSDRMDLSGAEVG